MSEFLLYPEHNLLPNNLCRTLHSLGPVGNSAGCDKLLRPLRFLSLLSINLSLPILPQVGGYDPGITVQRAHPARHKETTGLYARLPGATQGLRGRPGWRGRGKVLKEEVDGKVQSS